MLSKNTVVYLLLLLIVGFAGYYFGKINNQQANTIVQPIAKNAVQSSVKNNKSKAVVSQKVKQKIADKSYQQIQQENPYLPEYLPNIEVFDKIIDNLSAPEIDDYLNKLVNKNEIDFNQNIDKYALAKSLMREFLGENDNSNIDTYSAIKFSLSTTQNTEKITNFKLSNSKTAIYAHLQLDENAQMINNTFIKWIHIDSGKILLFENKNINPITRQNWVSFTPDENWQTGNYQVTFYQFNSELRPIIQGGYYVE